MHNLTRIVLSLPVAFVLCTVDYALSVAGVLGTVYGLYRHVEIYQQWKLTTK